MNLIFLTIVIIGAIRLKRGRVVELTIYWTMAVSAAYGFLTLCVAWAQIGDAIGHDNPHIHELAQHAALVSMGIAATFVVVVFAGSAWFKWLFIWRKKSNADRSSN